MTDTFESNIIPIIDKTENAETFSSEIFNEEVNMTGKIHTELQKQRDYLKAMEKMLSVYLQADARKYAQHWLR